TLGLVDADVVDETNLHRQVIHGTKDVGRPKLDSAEARIADVNPNVKVEKHETMLTSANALELFAQYDLVADGTDNFPTRYLVNDACVLTGKPNVYGSIFRFEGQASVFALTDGPCYRCLYPEPPPADARTITARELKARVDRGEDLAILDVREPQEFDLCRLPGSTLVPLGVLPAKLSELDSSKEMVVHCRTGKRSLQAIELLR